MLIIRLSRVGRKNDPSFRVVVTDSKNAAKSGKFLEIVGSYNARGGKTALAKDRIKHWLAQGVKMTETVRNILIDHKVIEGKKAALVIKKKASKAEAAKQLAK